MGLGEKIEEKSEKMSEIKGVCARSPRSRNRGKLHRDEIIDMTSIPLEDNFTDVVGKAQRGLGLSGTALAGRAGVTLGELNAVRGGAVDVGVLGEAGGGVGVGGGGAGGAGAGDVAARGCGGGGVGDVYDGV